MLKHLLLLCGSMYFSEPEYELLLFSVHNDGYDLVVSLIHNNGKWNKSAKAIWLWLYFFIITVFRYSEFDVYCFLSLDIVFLPWKWCFEYLKVYSTNVRDRAHPIEYEIGLNGPIRLRLAECSNENLFTQFFLFSFSYNLFTTDDWTVFFVFQRFLFIVDGLLN